VVHHADMTPVRERGGRPPATSRADLERVALELFDRDGFDETTIDDIAAAAGVGRRTVFRYFASKNDIVWGDFATGLRAMRASLAALPAELSIFDALTRVVVEFNALDPSAEAAHRVRMRLILRVPALQAHSTLMYADWRRVVSDFAAARLDLPPDAALPQLVGHLALAAAVAAYEQWLDEPGKDLGAELVAAFSRVGAGLAGL
jgi:mycofactocin system transcriptional regulator